MCKHDWIWINLLAELNNNKEKLIFCFPRIHITAALFKILSVTLRKVQHFVLVPSSRSCSHSVDVCQIFEDRILFFFWTRHSSLYNNCECVLSILFEWFSQVSASLSQSFPTRVSCTELLSYGGLSCVKRVVFFFLQIFRIYIKFPYNGAGIPYLLCFLSLFCVMFTSLYRKLLNCLSF